MYSSPFHFLGNVTLLSHKFLPISVAVGIHEFCFQNKGDELQFHSAIVLTCSLYLGLIRGREISVGFSLLFFFFFNLLVSCFLVVGFFGGVCFLIDW